jgi:TP901 family phage tail tape measure protein
MAEETIWTLGIDAGEAIATLDELGAALDGLIEKFAAVGSSAGDLTAVDDALSQLGTSSADSTAEVDGLNEALGSMSATIAEDTAIIDGLNETVTNLQAQLSALTIEESSAGEGAGGLAAMLSGAGEAISGFGESLQAAQGPLLMLSMAGVMLGKSLYDAGAKGQEGEALLSGMAGASTADIRGLEQEALKLGENMQQASAGFYEVESAGYSGAAALKVFDAASKLAEGGQASQKDTMEALTAIMHDYNASAGDSTHYTDLMAEAVLRGKQSMSDFASSIGSLASAGENVGLSFDQVAAAEATMTQINPHVKQDAQQLTSLFQFLSPTMGGVKKAADSLGLAFNEQAYNSTDLLGKLQILSDMAGGTNTAAFVKLTGGVRGSTAAIDLLKNGASSFKANLDAMGHSTGATQQAFDQFEKTVPAHMDKVSAAFSVLSTKVMDAIGPKIIPLIDNLASGIGRATDFITAHIDIVMPVLAGLAAFFGGAIIATIASFIISLGWVAVILAGIAVAVGGAVYAWQHWGQIVGQTNGILQNPAIQTIWHVFQGIGAFLAATFIPVWQQLVTTWQTQLVPAFSHMGAVVEPLKLLLSALAMIVGTILVVALGLLIGIIGGVISAFAGMLTGVIQAVGGVIQFLGGLVQFVSGFLALLVDLFTGQWGKIGEDLGVIWDGILNMWNGFGNAVMGIFNALVDGVIGLVSGFVQGVIGYFENLYHEVVGGSIIPDMVNGIISWLEQLPGRAGAVISSFISIILAGLANAASAAIQGGANIVNGIADGIRGAIGAVTGAISDVASAIAAHLPHSPAKEGPLRELLLQGSLITDQISEGMLSHLPKLQGAINQLTAPITVGISAPALSLPTSANLTPATGLSGNNLVAQLLTQILAQMQRQQITAPANNQLGTMTQNFGPVNINGVNDIQGLLTQFNQLLGQQAQYSQRGALFNY